MKKLIAFAVLLMLLVVAWRYGEFLARPVARRMIIAGLAESFAAPVAMGDLHISPWPLTIEASEVHVGPRGKELLAIRRVRFACHIWASAWQGAWIGDLHVQGAAVRYRESDPHWQKFLGREDGEPPLLPKKMFVADTVVRIDSPRQHLHMEIGGLNGHLTLGKKIISFRLATGTGTAAWKEHPPLDIVRVAAEGTWTPNSARLTQLLLKSREGYLQARGGGESFTHRVRYAVTGQIPLHRVSPRFPALTKIDRNANVQATVRGDLRHPTVDASVEIGERVMAVSAFSWASDSRGKTFQGRGSWRLSGKNFLIAGKTKLAHHDGIWRLTTRATDREKNSGELHAQLDPDTSLRGELRATLADLSPLSVFLGKEVSGRGRVEGTIHGSLEDPRWKGNVDFSDVAANGLRLPAITGAVEASTSGLASPGIAVRGEKGLATLSGSLSWRREGNNDWQTDVSNFAIAPLWHLLHPTGSEGAVSGQLDGRVTGRGNWIGPEVEGRGTISPLSIYGETFDQCELEGGWHRDQWRLRGTLRREEENLSFSFQEGAKEGLRGRVSSTPFRLRRFHALTEAVPGIDGTATLSAHVGGSISRPKVTAQLRISSVPLGQGDFHLEGQEPQWRLWGDLFQHGLSLRGTLGGGPRYPIHLDIRWQEMDVAPFILRRSGTTLVVAGNATLAGSLADPRNLDGELRLTHFEMERDGVLLAARQPIRIRGKKGIFEISSFDLRGDAGQFRIGGKLSTHGEAKLVVTGTGNLSLLEALSTTVPSASGKIAVRAELRRFPPEEWLLSGQAEVSDGAGELGPLALTEVSGRIVLEGSTLILTDVHAMAGGGDLSLGGDVDLTEGFHLRWQAKGVNTAVPSWLDHEISGQGTVHGAFDSPMVEGEVTIDKALYQERIDWKDFLPWARGKTQLLRQPPRPPLPLRFDLHLVADDQIFIDNNLAQMELKGDLRLTGTADHPGLQGTVEILEGRIFFRDRTFTVTSGTMTFTDPQTIHPVLNLFAETTVANPEGDYHITMEARGTLEDYRIFLYADDPLLTQDDAIALVTFGKTAAQLQREGAGIAVGDILALTSGPYAHVVEERLQQLLPVDRFEIEPTFSKTTGSIEPRITVAKDIASNFRALLGSSLGVERRQDVILEYHLTPRLFLQGRWEGETKSTAGAFGGDIKFRHEFSRLPRFSLWPAQ